MSLKNIVDSVTSVDLQEREKSLLLLLKKTKHKDEVENLFELDLKTKLFDLLEETDSKYKIAVLSILANCANISDNWREIVS